MVKIQLISITAKVKITSLNLHFQLFRNPAQNVVGDPGGTDFILKYVDLGKSKPEPFLILP